MVNIMYYIVELNKTSDVVGLYNVTWLCLRYRTEQNRRFISIHTHNLQIYVIESLFMNIKLHVMV